MLKSRACPSNSSKATSITAIAVADVGNRGSGCWSPTQSMRSPEISSCSDCAARGSTHVERHTSPVCLPVADSLLWTQLPDNRVTADRRDRVLIENWAVPHSHPVLTMNTRTAGDDLLSTYLHDQMHGWTDAQLGISDAINATREPGRQFHRLQQVGRRTRTPPARTSSSANWSIEQSPR